MYESDEMNRFLNLMASLFAKYGAEVLDEIEAEEADSQHSDELDHEQVLHIDSS